MGGTNAPRLGFVGTGAISEAVIRGLYDHGGYRGPISISSRNAQRSAQLSGSYPLITVEQDNQSIVDRCDWIVIAVLPEQAESVLRSLSFRQDQTVLSLVAANSLQTIRDCVAPATRVFRWIPMPPIEIGIGPIVVCPPNAEIAELLQSVGTVVQVESEEQFSAFSASSAVMATFFKLTAEMARWLRDNTVPPSEATCYSTALVEALASQTRGADFSALQEMPQECLTAGGLNEQMLQELTEIGWFDDLYRRWDRIYARITS